MNEFHNAWMVSQEIQRQENQIEIPEGMFAVVEYCLAHCRFTDAMLPHPDRRLVRCYWSRRIAEHVADRKNAELSKLYADEGGGECWYDVLPEVPRPVRLSDYDPREDEVPF